MVSNWQSTSFEQSERYYPRPIIILDWIAEFESHFTVHIMFFFFFITLLSFELFIIVYHLNY